MELFFRLCLKVVGAAIVCFVLGLFLLFLLMQLSGSSDPLGGVILLMYLVVGVWFCWAIRIVVIGVRSNRKKAGGRSEPNRPTS